MRCLVFAPHPDDEILGCAGLLARSRQNGDPVRVIVVSNGALAGVPAQREAESQAGLKCFGVDDVHFWNAPDGALPLSGVILEKYREAVRIWQPSHIALPSPYESHPDHRRLTRGLLTALEGQWQGELVFYETLTPLAHPNRFEPLDLQLKLTALSCHASQIAQFDYLAHAKGLATVRGAALRQEAAEGYLTYRWEGTAENFFEHRPLVSVILRADDAGFLALALESLAAQSYDHIEAIIVWHGQSPFDEKRIPPILDARFLQGPGPRSANLNAGLKAARGAYVAFLDQDDIWLPDHLATLLPELQADPLLDVVYGNTRIMACQRKEGVVTEQEEVGKLDDPYAPGRLLIGNHIALHSFLCTRRLACALGFDDALDAHEDWDFLARAELQGVRFRHIDEVVCHYRIYPEQGEQPDLETIHARKGFTPSLSRVRQKLFTALTPDAFFAVAKRARTTDAQNRALLEERDALRKGLTAQADELTILKALKTSVLDWADRLSTPTPGTDPLSRLAGALLAHEGPLISIIMPVCDPPLGFLEEALHSIIVQTYPHWELCLADDASTAPDIQALLTSFEQGHPAFKNRIRITRHLQRQGIVGASHAALEHASGSWLAFVDHDDRLDPDALLEIAKRIQDEPTLDALYTDSRMIGPDGTLLHEYRKPEWSPETLLHLNYINHLSVIRRDSFEKAGGLRSGFDGSQDWDIWLRLSRLPGFSVAHIPKCLYDWRASEHSVAYASSSKPYALLAACNAVQEHLTAKGLKAVDTQPAQEGVGVRSRWQAPCLPLTAIILTHRNPDDLAVLLGDLKAQDYPDLSVCLVANRVTDPQTLALLEQAKSEPAWSVIEDNRPFNWAALNNAAARTVGTPWLLFLNDDVSLPHPDTLRDLTRYLSLDPAIAIVGTRLHFPAQEGNGIQHDGIITDPVWVASDLRDEHASSNEGIRTPRNVSAVTGACLLTQKAVFEACAGFDERLAVSYNDVDYCLHARRLGYRIVQASDVLAIHAHSRTRGFIAPGSPAFLQWEEEKKLMQNKWGTFLSDPHRLQYNRAFAGLRIVHVPDA